MTNIILGGYTFDDATEIKRRVLGLSNSQKMLDGKKQLTVQNQQYYVKLLEPLDAATNPETGYTQANARILRYVQPVDPNSLDMEESGTGGHEILKITNRSTAFSAAIGETIRVDRMGSEWSPSHGSGGHSTDDGGCACSCLNEGDLVVNDVDTTFLMSVTFPNLVFEQVNGSITLPAGTYVLSWNGSTEQWALDIGDSLTSEYLDGSDATANTTMDGSASLTFPVSGVSTLSVCVTGTVPVPEITDGNTTGLSDGTEAGYSDGFNASPYDSSVPGLGTGSGTGSWSEYSNGYFYGYLDGYPDGYNSGDLQRTTEAVTGNNYWVWSSALSVWLLNYQGCDSLSNIPAYAGSYNGQTVSTACPTPGTGIGGP